MEAESYTQMGEEVVASWLMGMVLVETMLEKDMGVVDLVMAMEILVLFSSVTTDTK